MKITKKKKNRSSKIISRFFQRCTLFNKRKLHCQKLITSLSKHIHYIHSLSIISFSDIFQVIEILNIYENEIQKVNSFSSINKIIHVLEKTAQKYGITSISDILQDKIVNLEHYEWLNENFIILQYKFEKRPQKSKYSISFEENKHTYSNLNIQLHSCRIIIPFSKTIQLVCDGFLPYNIVSIYPTEFKVKYKNLKKKIKSVIPSQFANSYIKQLRPSVFCVNNIDSIVKIITEQYELLDDIKHKTISELVKLFLSSKTIKKREILILLLINVEDGETDHLAYLLYDMISSKSFMMTSSKSNTDNIFGSLHWSVQKKLTQQFSLSKNILDKSFMKYDEPSDYISYEKQIILMNTSDSVKGKAMAKLKEIKNGKGDSTLKATNYLDGLLKIPFGIYKNDFSSLIEPLRKNIIGLIKNLDINDKYAHIKWYNKLHTCKLNFMKSSKYFYDVELFFDNFVEINNLFKEYMYDICKELTNKELIRYGTWQDVQLTNKRTKKIIIKDLEPIYNIILNKEKSGIFENEAKVLSGGNILLEKWNLFQNTIKLKIKETSDILDKSVFGLDDAKEQLKRVFGQWITGKEEGYVFGFEGPMGTGKTTLAKQGISKCLIDSRGNSRPFIFIALGGSTNGSTLEGHNYTYVGSTWGKIVDSLMEAKCMNPIIYIDELDKISNTEHGREIIGILIHLTDPAQNEEFTDRYFRGIPIDLSKCLIIFSYNDPSKVDRILLDRIHRIKTKALSKYEKTQIVKFYVLPELLELVGFKKDDIILNEDVIHHIIYKYTGEAGVRKLKEKLLELLRELNIMYMSSQEIKLPFILTTDLVDKLFDKHYKFEAKKINELPRVGLINGLYASIHSRGGITLIQIFKKFSEKMFGLEITGQQGDVMKESITVAKTLSWHMLKENYREKFVKNNENFGFHLHCPETSTPKDGPSAGAAITTCFISTLTNLPITNTCAMTGEIDLHGNVMRIGGLSAKLEGARCAGVKKVLIPESNRVDLDKIIKYEKGFEMNEDFQVICVKTIYDVIPHMFSKKEQKKLKTILKSEKQFFN